MENKYKGCGFIPLHYGVEYLEAAIKSMEPFVDKIIIIYVSEGSQGARVPVKCPESEEDLMFIATQTSAKVQWVKGQFYRETDHRSAILNYTEGYDFVLSLDGDEILEPLDVPGAIEKAMKSDKRYIALRGFINFWKSFNWVCYDGFLPYRIINLHNTEGQDAVDCRVYHMGCCQSEAIMRYKWMVSGHRNEVKTNWIDNVWKAWSPENNFGDLHVVSIALWNAVPFDKETLPDILKEHINYNREVVE